MKIFKTIDIIMSLALIILFIVLLRTEELFANEFSMAYMITGAWQLLSMLVHLVKGWFIQSSNTRFWYHRIVAWYLPSIWLLALILYWLPMGENYNGEIWTWVVNISSTIMAVFYAAMCCIELIPRKKGERSTL